MKLMSLFLAVFVISACQSMYSDDPSSLAFDIPDGSTLTLKKSIKIPEYQTHVTIQSGKVVSKKDTVDYVINCNLELKKFGPRTINPEVFTISHTEDSQERISNSSLLRFDTEVHLVSSLGTDVIMLACQRVGLFTESHFTVSEMEEALGGYFSFSYTKIE